MKERPIIMSGSSVRAILAGRKTQTRRVMRLQPVMGDMPELSSERYRGCVVAVWVGESEFDGYECHCPQGAPGDQLWVKETWRRLHGGQLEFRADENPDIADAGPWKSPLFLRRTDNRLTLEVTNIRVEWLQQISDRDAEAEGFEGVGCNHQTVLAGYGCTDCLNGGYLEPPRVGFMHAWNELNAKRGFGWEINPWVWVIEFKRSKR